MFSRFIKASFLALIICSTAAAQQVRQPAITNAEWTKPYQPFRIAGNLYYVGTYDLACYLIVTPQGNILINTGVASSAKQIKKNIATLGFKYADIKILLTTQAHYDHVGAMALVKKQTGAKFWADEKEETVLEDGGSSDYAMGHHGRTFAPIPPDSLLRNNDSISLGGTTLVMLHHPGHTKGSCSYMVTVKDSQRSWKVLIANMPSIVTDKPLTSLTSYPQAAADYAYTLQAMKGLTFDIWVASHASQFDLHKKHTPGNAYNPAAFADQAGYNDYLNDLQKDFNENMRKK